jgi:hypothetical protein
MDIYLDMNDVMDEGGGCECCSEGREGCGMWGLSLSTMPASPSHTHINTHTHTQSDSQAPPLPNARHGAQRAAPRRQLHLQGGKTTTHMCIYVLIETLYIHKCIYGQDHTCVS